MRTLPRVALAILGQAALVLIGQAAAAAASSTGADIVAWQEIARNASTDVPGMVRPAHCRAFAVPLADLTARLGSAPREGAPASAGVEITLPLPDGRIERFRAVESPVLSPELQRAHPELRTYRAVGVDRPTLRARLDLTMLGLGAIVIAPEGTALIDPVERGRTDQVMSYWTSEESDGPFTCEAMPTPLARRLPAAPTAVPSGDQLRTLRLILMAPGEYAQWLGGVPQALAEMTASVDRIDAIFEQDLAIHLQVVALMPFPDPDTDPYPSAAYPDLFDRNQAVVDSIFGNDAYDLSQAITHQSSNSFNGISWMPAVCDNDYKAGSSAAAYDVTANWPFLKVMAHEMGHLLGAGHTQDNTCNRTPESAWEKGSGSTIMSYAGKCPPNVQAVADPYYHAGSIGQIFANMDPLTGCGTLTPTGDSPPSAEAGPDYVIPRSTFFVLHGQGADADPTDTLTYCWEEMDLSPTSGDLVHGPIFRSRPPSLSPDRWLPVVSTALADVIDPFEFFPTSDRVVHFRLTVRDNHPGGGGVAWDSMVVTMSGTPFAVTSPNGGETFTSCQDIPVTWQIGGGAVAPAVNIELSTDEGATWTVLAAGTPNDGAETVQYCTPTTSTTCRLRISAVGNIFYDISHADFTIQGGVTSAPGGTLPAELRLSVVGANPSAGRPAVQLDLPRDARVDLAVYSVQGRRLRTLAAGGWSAGSYRFPWDGTDGAGRRLASGVYFIHADVAGRRLSAKVGLAR